MGLVGSIIAELQKQDSTLDDDCALQKALPKLKTAKRIVTKIFAPTIRFISRRANLFAAKRLLCLMPRDRRHRRGEGSVRFAAGGACSFVIVVARAESGICEIIA